MSSFEGKFQARKLIAELPPNPRPLYRMIKSALISYEKEAYMAYRGQGNSVPLECCWGAYAEIAQNVFRLPWRYTSRFSLANHNWVVQSANHIDLGELWRLFVNFA